MNLPNKLTLARIILAPFFMVFLLIDNVYFRYLATLIFVTAALTDAYDGYLARKTGVITGFGKFMDPLADKILVSTAFISFVALGYVQAWMVLVIILREFLVTGLRSLAAYKGVVIMPSYLAKWKTACQMTVIVAILVYVNLKSTLVSPGDEWPIFSAHSIFSLFDIMVFVTMLLTVVTGIDYVVKNGFLIKGVLK
ncbi:MAG: CDP-diacylglycerol--glycerol-3-phosphate 3-phosphatidyltransferase [candidate division Zixibacteria bacterium]|nr:CDP-diacylglycerol--glycerol-3-phosphate 3-phosphatidyltransferase [candidate division Zixibacteria bacterium]